MGFINGHSGTTVNPDYAYDDNGNLTKDLNKGIVGITYNHLNLPEIVEKDDGQRIQYTYDAAGLKLAQQVYETEVIERASTLSTQWANNYVNRSFITGPVGGENDMLRVYATSHNNVHRIAQNFAEIAGKSVHVKARIYLPSGNTNVDGIQLAVGNYVQDQIYTTTDQWINVAYILEGENNNNGSVFFSLLSNGATHYVGANSATDDVFYVKDIEVSTISLTKSTDYIGEFIYENDKVALIQHEEGRIVPNATTGEWAYEYYLKDHLGNTRVTFTTNPKEIEFTLNYESNPAVPDDIALFEEVAPANTISNDLFDYTDEAGTTYTHTQLLTGGLNAQVGSVIAIPVGMGDTLNAEVFAKYKDNTGNGNNSGAAIAGLLINAFTGGTGMTNELGNQSINNNFGGGSLIGTTGFAPEDANAPMAFLNVMFLPEDDVISLEKDVSFAYDQVDGAAMQPNTSNKAAHDRMHIDNFVAPDQGYVLVYLSNESAVMTEVYFDDLKVTLTEHPVIQTDDYYPFGLTFNSYERITAKKNRYKFNQGTGDKKFRTERITDLDLNLDMTKYRMYDYTTGRFTSIDPLSDAANQETLTPYQYGYNNPIKYSDPYGDCPGCKTFLRASKNWLASKAGDSEVAQFALGVLDVAVGTLESVIFDPVTDAADMANQAAALGESIAEGNVEGIIANSPTLAADVKATSDMVNDVVDGDKRAQGQVAATAVSMIVGGKKITKPPRGKGSVPPKMRDPKRTFTKKQKAEMLQEQGGNCPSCKQPKTVDQVDGHHIKRHADGGATTKDNGVSLCKDCHKNIHKKE
ncbi:MAG: RHS repeat-associated core domain-containing protein [Bacteroidota bacterium]